MPPETGPKTSSTADSVLLRGRVTRSTTLVNQCKLPELSPWFNFFPEFLTIAPLKPDQSLIPHPVLGYIVGEMTKNATSAVVKKVRELNESHAFQDALAKYKKQNLLWKILFGQGSLDQAMDQDISSKAAARIEWACLVADARTSAIGCGIWDHKPYIRGKWGVAQRIDFSPISKTGSVSFYYDIWSNIHYGYVGRAAGFTEQELIDGANGENWVSNTGVAEPPSDTVSIQIGVQLLAETLDLFALLRKLYEKKGHLHRYDPNRPDKQRVYTDDK